MVAFRKLAGRSQISNISKECDTDGDGNGNGNDNDDDDGDG